MKPLTIKIGRKSYCIEFNFGAMKLLSKNLGYNSFGDVQQRMMDLKFDKIKTDLSFEQYDFLGIILSAAIEVHEENATKLSAAKCTEALFNDLEMMAAVMQLFSDAVFKRLGKTNQVQPSKRQK